MHIALEFIAFNQFSCQIITVRYKYKIIASIFFVVVLLAIVGEYLLLYDFMLPFAS